MAGGAIAVIGTGLDGYPRYNAFYSGKLRSLVFADGYPQQYALPEQFYERNRIIAGLCHACLVVEGSRRSGSLITASLALQDNRNVGAVPGQSIRQCRLEPMTDCWSATDPGSPGILSC